MRGGSRGIHEPYHATFGRNNRETNRAGGPNRAGGANRSESVRERRSQRVQQRASTAGARAANPVQQRPVMVRGMLNTQARPLYRQAAQSRPRRAFYVAMDGAAGTELRLPSIPIFHPGWRLMSGLIVCAVLFALFSVWNSPFFRVNQVSILGLQRVSAADLDTVVHLENLSIIEVQPERVKEEITAAFPELADVQVSVELPNFVTISARERQPMLAWQKDDTTDWVDPEGYIFPARGEAGPLVTIYSQNDIPLVRLNPGQVTEETKAEPEAGLEAGQEPTTAKGVLTSLGYATSAYANRRADMRILNASLQLVKLLPEGTQIVYDKDNGLGWTDAGGWQVYIGKDLNHFEERLATYQTIVNDLSNRGIRPDLVSVAHLNAPFFRSSQMEAQSEEQ